MADYTPGPWIVCGEDQYAEVLSPDRYVIAKTDHIHSGDPEAWDDIHLANMRLISAAPDLLKACESLPLDCEFEDAADFKDNASQFLQAMELARVAIAKAKPQ